MVTLDAETAEAYLALAAGNILRPYPNAPGTVVNGPADALTPRELHPAFYGCFDWHSCVHQHWLVARLLPLFPDLPAAGTARRVMHQTLTPVNIWSEVDYLRGPNRETFERTYGWAWLLELDRELLVGAGPGDADAAAWRAALAPPVELLVERWVAYLPRAWYPIRAGTHANSAFGLSFLLEHARATGNAEAVSAAERAAVRWFGADDGYDAVARFEPSGADFLSPTLTEADLMGRVLAGADEFVDWFDEFLPEIPPQLLGRARVEAADRTTDSSSTSTGSTSPGPGTGGGSPTGSRPTTSGSISPEPTPVTTSGRGYPASGRASSWASTGWRRSPCSPSPTSERQAGRASARSRPRLA